MVEHFSDKPKEGEGIRRRTLLQALLALAVSSFTGSDADAQQKGSERLSTKKRERMPRGPRSLRDVLMTQVKANDTVTINADLAEETRKIWHREYENAFGKGVVDRALERVGPERLKAIRDSFEKHGVPEHLLYLAIVESQFQEDKESDAGAVGPFQFIEETGATYGLVAYNAEGGVIRDERKDYVKSGDACARLLKDNFARYKGRGASDADAWRFATHQYNGSFSFLYLRSLDARTKPTYDGFLAFMQERMRRALTRTNEPTEYVVQKGQTLSGIARRFRISLAQLLEANRSITDPKKLAVDTVIIIPALPSDGVTTYHVRQGQTLSRIAQHVGSSVEKLKAENQLKDDRIQTGQKLKVPADATHIKEILARNKVERVKGLIENLEYTLKIDGLLRAMKERGLDANIQ